MGRAGRLLDQLDRHRLPVHVTPVIREMLLTMSDALPRSVRGLVRRLLETRLTDLALSLPPSLGPVVDPLLRNTVTATIVRGGDNINVIPGEVVLDLDGRLLPGQRPEDLLAELRRMVGKNVEFDLTRHDQGPATPDLRLFATLGDILREADPGSVPVPLLLAGATDARHFARLGIQTYGFLPMNLSPKDAHLLKNIHDADERIPVGAVTFGAQAVHEALRRFGVR